MAAIARYLLGLIFVVFGADKFVHFIPQGPMPTGAAGQFVGVLLTHMALGSGIVVAILWILVFLRVRPAFQLIFEPRKGRVSKRH